MSGIGVLLRVAGKVGGRILGRAAGPVGAAITIGELGYLGLKYSGTLENFKKLYCDKCRAEIPHKSINKISSQFDPGAVFEVSCPGCGQAHALSKIHLLCSQCKSPGREQQKHPDVTVPAEAKYLSLTCPGCQKTIKLVRNKKFGK